MRKYYVSSDVLLYHNDWLSFNKKDLLLWILLYCTFSPVKFLSILDLVTKVKRGYFKEMHGILIFKLLRWSVSNKDLKISSLHVSHKLQLSKGIGFSVFCFKKTSFLDLEVTALHMKIKTLFKVHFIIKNIFVRKWASIFIISMWRAVFVRLVLFRKEKFHLVSFFLSL